MNINYTINYNDFDEINCNCGKSSRCIICGGSGILYYYNGDFISDIDIQNILEAVEK